MVWFEWCGSGGNVEQGKKKALNVCKYSVLGFTFQAIYWFICSFWVRWHLKFLKWISYFAQRQGREIIWLYLVIRTETECSFLFEAGIKKQYKFPGLTGVETFNNKFPYRLLLCVLPDVWFLRKLVASSSYLVTTHCALNAWVQLSSDRLMQS